MSPDPTADGIQTAVSGMRESSCISAKLYVYGGIGLYETKRDVECSDGKTAGDLAR